MISQPPITYRRPKRDELIRMPVGFPEALHAWMRSYGERVGVPAAEIVRQAVVEYRERVDAQLDLPIASGE